jgi:hypothetical protein
MVRWPSFVGAWLCLTALRAMAQPQSDCGMSVCTTAINRPLSVVLSLAAGTLPTGKRLVQCREKIFAVLRLQLPVSHAGV